MSNDFNITIKNPIETQKIGDLKGLVEVIKKVLADENDLTVAHIQERYASFPQQEPVTMDGLRTISGYLRRGYWAAAPTISGGNITSSIGNNMVYARIHEFGGKTRPHDIVARNAKALAIGNGGKFFTAGDFNAALHGTRAKNRAAKTDLFIKENGIVFRRLVHHPGSNIPARRPIQRGIEDRLPAYGPHLAKAITDFAKN